MAKKQKNSSKADEPPMDEAKPFDENKTRERLEFWLYRFKPEIKEKMIRGVIANMRRRRFYVIRGGRADDRPETLRGKCDL
jgi:hypothetical protein